MNDENVRKNAISALRSIKELLCAGSVNGAKMAKEIPKGHLSTTASLFGSVGIVEELKAINILKQIDGKDPTVEIWTWDTKDTPEEAFEKIILERRHKEQKHERERASRPVHYAEMARFFADNLQVMNSKIDLYREEIDAYKELHRLDSDMVRALQDDAKTNITALQTLHQNHNKLVEKHNDAINGISEALKQKDEQIMHLKEALQSVMDRLSMIAALPSIKGQEEFIQMVTEDVHEITTKCENVETNVRNLMASFQQKFQEAQLNGAANGKTDEQKTKKETRLHTRHRS